MRLNRRSFLQLTALAGGGLALNFYRSPLAAAQGPGHRPTLRRRPLSILRPMAWSPSWRALRSPARACATCCPC